MNYALIINSEKNNSRKLKAAYIVNKNLKNKENILIITSILNIMKWKSLFFTFSNITIYKNEENIIENKVEHTNNNLIICIDFLPKTLNVTCDIIILDMCHFNIINQISILNELCFLNYKKKILIFNNICDNWNFISSLFLLNNPFFNKSFLDNIQMNYSEDDKKIINNMMLDFISHFCILNKQKNVFFKDQIKEQNIINLNIKDDEQNDISKNNDNKNEDTLLQLNNEKEIKKNKNLFFILTYMSGVQKCIYDHADEKHKRDTCIHPLLLLNEDLFLLKDFNISEKFEILKNIIKKCILIKKKIVICYSGDEKILKLIKILLHLYGLNDFNAITYFTLPNNNQEQKENLNNLDIYDVSIIINDHISFLKYFKNVNITCYFLISTFTKEEDELLQLYGHEMKELYFYKKKKKEIMKANKSYRDFFYRYYLNNLISDTDEQFLMFNIIDQKEKIYCNVNYNEMVLPTCFVSSISDPDQATQYSDSLYLCVIL
ncbi:hypothetical protein PFTANZ_03399 [Plasmodium falciparum Tanzania (2000708)]|uniref:Uncharacterized protein n=1 Tax=Plasmodium falciparum Tanzania (2000708) TaxID=1036725 RepID=A0A024W6L0_PLAFA|nr:hypothetical protein PFTANZ_03399 [Plasmodium falciparum Tanzania (2000708)]